MTRPAVTIVTPSFNQGGFIRATIESVLSQGYPNLEYIVMDGGSTDETASVVKDYASRIIWISEPDRGQSHAINKGFRLARGEVVAWLNSDDLFLPGAIQRAVVELRERPEFAAVYGNGYLIDRGGNITRPFPFSAPFDLWKLVNLSDYILQQTVYFRRQVFDEVGFIREDLHFVMDWDILIRIGKRFQMGFIPDYLGCLREYPEAKSFAGGRDRIREIRSMLREHTGVRFPPGYVVYGLDAYRQLWIEGMESATPRLLRSPSRTLQRLLYGLCGNIIGRQITHSQGWFSDGWAARNVNLMVPAACNQLRLSGLNPTPSASPTSIQVRVDGCPSRRYPLPHGDFSVTIALPEASADAHRVRLIAKGFPLNSVGPDGREMLYQLVNVNYESVNASVFALPEPTLARLDAEKLY